MVPTCSATISRRCCAGRAPLRRRRASRSPCARPVRACGAGSRGTGSTRRQRDCAQDGAAVTAAALWDQYVAGAGADAATLAGAAGDAARLAALGQLAFRIGLSSLLVGAEDVGRLALAIEHAIDRGAGGDAVTAELGAAIATLHDAFVQLGRADRSGARVENLPIDERRRALDTGLSAPGISSANSPIAGAPSDRFAWTPSIDDDMIEMFFDEATERIAALAGKLVEIERRPDDGELVRDVFRDLHTLKGSSAMVGLAPVNQLAHAAEDLVGQIRDAGRAVDGAVIDALLAALDGLRDMLAQARAEQAVSVDPAPAIARLRNPSAPVAPLAPALAAAPLADAGAQAARTAASAGDAARQTIRVDFDKLDRLLNLVGELVLGRDGLRGAVHALGSITTELASDSAVARRVARARGSSVPGPAVARGGNGPAVARGLEQ